MSKSLGNSLFANELLNAARPVVLRYFLGSAHYRSVLEFHETALAEADAAFTRIETFLDRANRTLSRASLNSEQVSLDVLPDGFVAAMHDDFGVPQALAVMFDLIRSGNAALDSGDVSEAGETARAVDAMLHILGIHPHDPHWNRSGDSGVQRALGALVDELIAARTEARANRDFALSDRLRDQLAAAGITLEDSATGTHWSIDVE